MVHVPFNKIQIFVLGRTKLGLGATVYNLSNDRIRIFNISSGEEVDNIMPIHTYWSSIVLSRDGLK